MSCVDGSGKPAPDIPAPRLILIDLDGTLVDTVPDLAMAADAMMRDLGLPERGEAAVREWIGNGVARLVKRTLTNSLDREPDPDLFERAHEIFLDHYARDVCTRSRPYPGVVEGLDRLEAAAYRLGCVTNKPARFTEPLLAALDLTRRFEIVVSGDTLPVRKPDPGQLLYAAERTGVEPADALMVGDSSNDVLAARAAGFRVVCVPYGYNHGHDIREADPDAIVADLVELSERLPRPSPYR